MISSAAVAAEADPPISDHAELSWTYDAPWFGGLSGAEVSDDGRHLTAISDRGRVMRAELLRDDAGKLVGMNLAHSVAMRDLSGKILNRPFTDAEGLAIGAGGDAYVSFEGQHRLAKLNLEDGTTTPIARLPDFIDLKENAGFEALAIDAVGTLYALPETSVDDQYPIYTFDGSAWKVIAYLAKDGPFRPVGADIDSDGRLYLLERTVTPLGFRSRIRRIDLALPNAPIETLLRTLPGRYDNLEAITVWKDAAGQIRLTLVSDDNFLAIQQTQMVEFTVK